ncbi:transmembrane protein 42 isoform X2 [Cygnus atratus]|uniref:transmembrane protein 42 isoform X2 n=1 Tax=Cygnus atratus TaxID=8868 RepID=UPI0015D580B3|nr:transmembrane protein 42 isoform X2 [Cygnus atratus]
MILITAVFLKPHCVKGHVGLLAFHLKKCSVSSSAQLPVLFRVGCIGLVCACNAVMWTVFAKALRLSSSSATASVTTTASNFISSAILGKLLFGETWTPVWWVGLAMTLCGLVLLHTAAPRPALLPAEKKET